MRAAWIKIFRLWRRASTSEVGAIASATNNRASPSEHADSVESRVALVKPRPVSLEQRYALLDQSEQADEIFIKLKQRLYNAIDDRQSGPTVFRESGRLAPGRPYFYLKAAGEKGVLCERTGAGWVISRAEKIVDRNLFLREGEPVDAVELYVAGDRATLPRVRSQTLGDGLLAMAVYEQKLRQQLGVFKPP